MAFQLTSLGAWSSKVALDVNEFNFDQFVQLRHLLGMLVICCKSVKHLQRAPRPSTLIIRDAFSAIHVIHIKLKHFISNIFWADINLSPQFKSTSNDQCFVTRDGMLTLSATIAYTVVHVNHRQYAISQPIDVSSCSYCRNSTWEMLFSRQISQNTSAENRRVSISLHSCSIQGLEIHSSRLGYLSIVSKHGHPWLWHDSLTADIDMHDSHVPNMSCWIVRFNLTDHSTTRCCQSRQVIQHNQLHDTNMANDSGNGTQTAPARFPTYPCSIWIKTIHQTSPGWI